jgi:hypothetical protein
MRGRRLVYEHGLFDEWIVFFGWFWFRWKGIRSQDSGRSGRGYESGLDSVDRNFVVPAVVVEQKMLCFLGENSERSIIRALERLFYRIVSNVDVSAGFEVFW